MGQFFDSIPDTLLPWIHAQKIFFVASAPLTAEGHVNVSPKGFCEGSFHVVGPGRVWYEDLSGSGIETISHMRENGRITIMFVAFEGPPRIVRLFRKGTVHEFGTPEYDALLPPEDRQPGSRAAIVVDVHKVGASCGFSIPFFEFKSPRVKLHRISVEHELMDVAAEVAGTACPGETPSWGMKNFWKRLNLTSIDGLPGLSSAFESRVGFRREEGEKKLYTWKREKGAGESADGKVKVESRERGVLDGLGMLLDGKMLFGMVVGVLLSMAWWQVRMRWML